MEKAPDRVAAERTLYHLGWKYALDLELGAGGFHPTVLVYFRDGLEEKKAERVIFDAAVDLLVELGLIKRKGKQRLDSTHIVGYVKEMSRLECATETMRLALRDLRGNKGDRLLFPVAIAGGCVTGSGWASGVIYVILEESAVGAIYAHP